MPFLAAISKIDFPYKVAQQEVKIHAQKLFSSSVPGIERIMSVFDNTEIQSRNFCKPLEYYGLLHTFNEQNLDYISITLEYSVKAIEKCLDSAQIKPSEITDIIFVSTTGLATPSIDALIINKMRLNENIVRTPIFGLGCAGGAAGFAKANVIAKANPNAIVLLVAAELCSLTFLKNDFSKSNFIGSSLFADGIAACLINGDHFIEKKKKEISYIGSQSKFYYNTLDVMGWDFQDDGFKVLFSQNIPVLIAENIKTDVNHFLSKHNLTLADIDHFIFHPGGKKVLTAYEEALNLQPDLLENTKAVITDNGNMSSPTVLYVLEKFVSDGYKNGYGLMVAMGPGFSSEMVLLKMQNN